MPDPATTVVNKSRLNRRRLIQSVFPAVLWMGAGKRVSSALPAVRTITSPPQHHWFGYYDKFQFDPSNRRAGIDAFLPPIARDLGGAHEVMTHEVEV